MLAAPYCREEDERDARRYRFLRDLPPVVAQAYFWNHASRRERDKAIDADIAAAAETPPSHGTPK